MNLNKRKEYFEEKLQKWHERIYIINRTVRDGLCVWEIDSPNREGYSWIRLR